MIAFLISMLLMPFVPQLQSPRDTYSDQLASVMKYLEHATPAVAQPTAQRHHRQPCLQKFWPVQHP
jgi:hypothetical protein